MSEILSTPDSVDQLIQNRRSIFPKLFTGETIDRSVIEAVLENANWAPTHRYTEPWRFQVITGPALVGFYDYVIEHYQKETPPEKFNPKKIEKYELFKSKVSHILAIVMRRDPEKRVPEVEEICSVACAVQNFWLSLDSHGIAGYWSTGYGTFTSRMHKKMGLGPEDRLLGFFLLGIPTAHPPGRARGPIGEKVTWHTESF